MADSRLHNLKKYEGLEIPKYMLRLPMISEAEEVVKYSDVSLNSEYKTIQVLDQATCNQNKLHGVILMWDLGDLREGIFDVINV